MISWFLAACAGEPTRTPQETSDSTTTGATQTQAGALVLGAEVPVDDETLGTQHHATVATLADRTVVAWDNGTGEGHWALARPFHASGEALGPSGGLSPVEIIARPAIIAGAETSTWISWAVDNELILLGQYASTGTPIDDPRPVTDDATLDVEEAAQDLTERTDGHIAVVWSAFRGLEQTDAVYRMLVFDPFEETLTPVLEFGDSPFGSTPPAVAPLPDGGVVAAWVVFEEGQRRLVMGAWQEDRQPSWGPFDVATDHAHPGRPMLDATAGGLLALTTFENQELAYTPHGATLWMFDAFVDAPICSAPIGQGDSAEQPVANFVGDDALLVVWAEGPDSLSGDIFAQLWNLDCQPTSDPVQINEIDVDGHQERPSLSVSPDGSTAAITFESYRPAAAESDVFLRHMTLPPPEAP